MQAPRLGRVDGVEQRVADDLEVLVDTEAQLARSLALTRRVLDSVADGVYGLGPDGRVQFVNAAACRMTGYTVDEQLGGDQHALVHHAHADGSPYPREACPTRRAQTLGITIASSDEVFWRKDGSPVPVEMVSVPTLEDGVVTGVVVSFRDLTARQEAERQAQELRELSAREAQQRELADRLQQALLTPPPEPEHLEIVVRYQPAAREAQVGGDWYDAFLQPDGAVVLVIGDVVGHDGQAAARMGQLRGLLRALAYDSADGPAAVLTRTERAARGLAVDGLATVVVARVERTPDLPVTGSRTLRWTNAGHLPPVLLHADGSTELLDTEPDVLVGLDADLERQDHTVQVPDGSTLLLFTDGLVERRGEHLDIGLLALQAVLRGLAHLPLPQLCDELLARMSPQAGDDDIALLAVRAHPEDALRPAGAGDHRSRGPLV